jgi:PAS domain S-box-containing protein
VRQGVIPLLKTLSEQIRLCHERALEARERADETADPEMKADFLNIEKRWLILARSYEFGERLDDFTRENTRNLERARAFEPGAMLQASGAAVFGKDRNSRMIAANPACLRVVGKAWEEIRGRSDVEWHDDRVQARSFVSNDRTVIESGEIHIFEQPLSTPSGPRIMLSTKAPLFDGDGQIAGIVGVAMDITGRRRREETTEFLHKELKHRLGNSLAIVQAIAQQTIDPGDGLERFEQRLIAYARSQQLVVESLGKTVSLHDLIRVHRLGFNMDGRVNVEGGDVPLKPAWAIYVGMAINELATNSVKYGALGGDGRVNIGWTVESAGEQCRNLVFSWHEIHDRPHAETGRTGFGHTVLTRIVPAQLNGAAALTINAGELRWTLHAPITA